MRWWWSACPPRRLDESPWPQARRPDAAGLMVCPQSGCAIVSIAGSDALSGLAGRPAFASAG